MREAMARLPAFHGGRLVVASSDEFTPAGCFADATHVVPLIRSPDYVDRLLAVAEMEDIRVVIPLIDLDLDRLAPHLEQFARRGISVICPPPKLVDLTMDKLAFARFAAARSLPHPPTWLIDEVPTESFPVFFKRRRGFGSLGAGIANSSEEARAHARLDPHLVFQPLIRAEEVSIDAYIARSGGCVVCVPRVRDKVVAGESYKSHTIRDREITNAARRVIDALSMAGLRGPLNVQLFATQPPTLLEVNTRLGSAAVLSNMATDGRLFEAILDEATGGEARGDPEDYTDNLALSRFLGDVFHRDNMPVAIKPAKDPRPLR